MLAQILQKTPTWVFGVFLLLLGLGFAQSRPRRVSRDRVWALPAAMALLSVYTAVSAFGVSVLSVTAWLVGYYFSFWRNAAPEWQSRIAFDPADRRFLVPGSWIPLGLMMAVFFLRYAVAVATATRPSITGQAFVFSACLAYGALSGAFAARARAIWIAQPGVRATLPMLPLSRRALVLSVLGVLALLDLGRSINAHAGYSKPAEIWQPDPKAYADIVWPPGLDVAATAPPGQKVYLRNCAMCHGPDGRGNGASAPSMIPRPRDFTRGEFKYKTTSAGSAPSDNDLRKVIASGLHASGMPYFGDVLDKNEIEAVAGYVKTFSQTFSQPVQVVTVAPRPPVTEPAIARGRELYREQGCITCHGDKLRGGLELKDAKGLPVVSRDLTAPWTFRGGNSPEQVFLRLTTGMAPSPMPAYATLPAQSRWDLVAFLESQRRVPAWEAGGQLAGPGATSDLKARGRYLVHSEMCGLCHTQVNAHGIYREDRYLAGGMLVGAHPQGIFVSANLTPDDETGLGRWSEDEIVSAIRLGRAKDGRLLNFWGMPWMYLHNLSEDDARAIARYLKTLPPVRNEIPATVHYGFIETVMSKIWNGGVFLGRAPVLTYAAGSYANLEGWRPDRVQSVLIAVQWTVIALGLLSLPLTSPARVPRTPLRRSLRTAGIAVAVTVACVAGHFLYNSPTLGYVPPEKVGASVSSSIPAPRLDGLTPERAALVKRGRAVFASASCAYCHGNDGAGGFKQSGGNGSIYTPNISSDLKAGIGSWSDAQIARAIRTGVNRSGRPLYWQSMPWDHFSNFDEEDVVALVAYMRMLPPVSQQVPPYRPPSEDDCRVYTFWTSKNFEPGCK